jgi:non-ribosomal peptide synthetase component F
MSNPLSARFHHAYEASKLTVAELWLRYFALGGEASELEVDAYLNGAIALPALQHDMLAQAINERLDEMATPRAPYSDDFMPLDYLDQYLQQYFRNDETG